ncbi:hypothetical protein [Nocardia mangyaensis]|uniref:hypothetical protein n=1 Tax=Nocardia mangyaensis TaxID=2213200 RepID=UPI002677647E|nr:hypothetical protein [Nocardia mangyaensis]MDO3650309.1 hypothetical protein [Nocardia mangyaensis]
MQPGSFIMQRGRWDIGRVGVVQGSRVRIEYFESVAEPVVEAVDALAQDCQPVTLPVGARVFWCDPDTGDWTAGRVTARQNDLYFVRFPNSSDDRRVSGSDLRVRWNRPVRDPLHVLTAGGSEPWFFRQARLPMLNALVRQRAACANVPAFLSSAVELFPHQVEASLTVLSDPVQRYLLADEVGLGKTVEAGFVIRQTLIDNPLAKITILTPDVLRRQWIRELAGKFFTDDFPRAEIKVLAHETPTGWVKHLNSDLLVVDEAHALVRGGDPNLSPYRELVPLAHTAARLLLLSATPITSNLLTSRSTTPRAGDGRTGGPCRGRSNNTLISQIAGYLNDLGAYCTTAYTNATSSVNSTAASLAQYESDRKKAETNALIVIFTGGAGGTDNYRSAALDFVTTFMNDSKALVDNLSKYMVDTGGKIDDVITKINMVEVPAAIAPAALTVPGWQPRNPTGPGWGTPS